MKTALLKWIAGLAVAISQTVSATPITDTVIVGSKEWAQVDLFTDVRWTTLNTQCSGGVCAATSVINGYDLAGWTWASIDTVQDLFNTYTGQSTSAPGIYSEADSSWAITFTEDFRPTYVQGEARYTLGFSSSTAPLPDYAYAPYIIEFTNRFQSDSARTDFSAIDFVPSSRYGAWFVREARTPAVPVPVTLTLFSLGLASLWATRRKSGAKV